MLLEASASRPDRGHRLTPQSHAGHAALALTLVLLLILWQVQRARAAEPCAPGIARLVSVLGTVDVRRAGTDPWQPGQLDDLLCIGDTVRVAAASRAALAFVNDSVLSLDALTTLRLRGLEEERRSLLDLLLGAVQFFSHRPRALEINTPFVNAAAEGTEFFVRVAEEHTEVIMLAGRVRLTNPQGELLLAAGDAALVPAGQAPQPQIVARPRDAVAWALYYPPVLTPLATGEPQGLPAGLRAAVARVAANDYPGALAALDEVPEAARDAQYHTYRAGILLNVGQVEPAQAAIERALALDPAAGEALAQRSIIALVQNRRADALADARRAVELAPESSAAAIALSYALQGDFQLEEARAVLRETVQRHPEDALAWARLAEIEQSFGELGRARDAAERAVALAPNLARTQMVLGFAALTRIDIGGAKAAFERSIALDSANPLPRLGLGLARIRESNLEAGRSEIEIAAALDPNDSLIRSYLGKAFFEERRDAQAGEQYAIAKELDPNDPTPWLYDAIRLQLANRPVEALRNINRSIELNDNRAPYRSRLLLDEDLATRSVSLARIYDDLGFDQLALNEATRSLSQDPANWSAHRFLSDAYARLPRHEIARVSELLQAQLLQPINISPVQPSLAVTDLNIVSGLGPAEGAFNEFHPLFARNDVQLTATGLVGNNDTYGGESVLSMVANQVSLSVGGLLTDTDGFRDNTDVRNKLANAFAQVALTPKLGLQAEYRLRDTDKGDLGLDFDPDDFDETLTQDIEQESARIGLRFSPAIHSDFIVSVIYSERKEDQIQTFPPVAVDGIVFPSITLSGPSDEEGYQAEAQYLLRGGLGSLVSGLGFNKIDVANQDFVDSMLISDVNFESIQQNVYVYGNIEFPDDLIWTMGVSYDDFEEGRFDRDSINPKVGLQWNITDNLRLRLGAFRTLKRRLIVDQTVEPTQVAGFNQFFDFANGTRSWRYGAGLDARLLQGLYGGLEFLIADLSVPRINVETQTARTEDQDETLYRAYLYWTPHPWWAIDTEALFDDFEREASEDLLLPTDVETFSAPVFVRLFHPSGVFAALGGTYVHQEVRRPSGSPSADGTNDFVVVDAAIGYRLPQRRGIVSLEARNVLDEEFRYQDDNFRTPESSNPRFIPDRSLLLRATVTF